MVDFAIYYIESNLVCIIVFAILLIHNHFNIDRQEKQIKFDYALIAFIVYFIGDIIWAAITAEYLSKTRLSVCTISFVMCILLASITYFWLDYVLAFEQVPGRDRPIRRFAVLFPFLTSALVLFLNLIIAPELLVNDKMDTLPLYSIYLLAVPCIYMVAILFYTIRRARRVENPGEKRRHLFVGFFPLLTMAGGLMETVFFSHMPIYCFSSMILMLVFYIQSVAGRVSLDPLTRLNNRGQLLHYTSQKANLYLDDRMTFVVMMDINDFKKINDTYGHAEGDNALTIVADSLKQVVNRHNLPCFLGRYGGDEFILILHPFDREEPPQIIHEIRDEIDQLTRKRRIPYQISIGAGYDELKGNQDTFQECMKRADKLLYQDKKIIKMGRNARS